MIAFPGPWCCLWDFNVIIRADECIGSSRPVMSPCVDFQNFTNHNNLIHLPTLGAQFTWTNRMTWDAPTEEILNRSICNDERIDAWNQVTCNIMLRLSSNHHSFLLHYVYSTISRITQFRFHKTWLKDLSCRSLIARVWNTNVVGCPMFILIQKLNLQKKDLILWNINTFGNIHLRVQITLEKVDLVQACINAGYPNNDLLQQEPEAQSKLLNTLDVEET
ncbi:hypothetical protein Lal_00044683 [Lupinus albus]|nr:hypothetical protein Lal_00044683 [Lupinus albus]